MSNNKYEINQEMSIIMKKRTLSLFLAVIFSFIGITGKLFSLSVLPKKASNVSSLRNRTIASSRGMITDRNLSPLTNESYSHIAVIKPTNEALSLMDKLREDKEVKDSIIKGHLTFKRTSNSILYEGCDDIKLLKIYERYTDSFLIHILGYTDQTGKGVSGIEKYYNSFLSTGGGDLSVVYSADAQNRLLSDELIEIRDNGYYTPKSLILTIDKSIQEILENSLDNNKITKGAGVILDNETGEILACASRPVYKRNNLYEALKNEDSPFINRAFSQYPAGSVFKVVTAAAAIENNIKITEFNCTGKIAKTENVFYCNKLDGHGKIDFNEAVSKSCNPYFIELGVKTGGEALLNTAKKLHLGESNTFGNGYMTDKGTLPSISELQFEADIGNFAFGQGKLTATPLQIASVFSCIANGGIYKYPTLIKGTADESGNITENKKLTSEKVLKNNTCEVIKKGLKQTVIDGTGKPAFSEKLTSYSKTATAQSGQYDKNGNEIKFCWFVGFFPEDNPKYTVCIMKENGISGGGDCGPAFKEVAEKINKMLQ